MLVLFFSLVISNYRLVKHMPASTFLQLSDRIKNNQFITTNVHLDPEFKRILILKSCNLFLEVDLLRNSEVKCAEKIYVDT